MGITLLLSRDAEGKGGISEIDECVATAFGISRSCKRETPKNKTFFSS